MPNVKSKVFLSHATPEDNDFTRWLAAKLCLAGYEVWCDFNELKGGDVFWDKIEGTIRHESARLIAIVSPASYKKNGVKNEWTLAATIEKQIPGFIIPVRIGSFDFSELPIVLHQKNVIDFDAGWHVGLCQLLNTLEASSVPKSDVSAAADALGILRQGQELKVNLVDAIETVESTWLELERLPPTIEVCRILSALRGIGLTDSNRSIPWFEIEDRIASFAKRCDIKQLFADEVPLREAEACLTEDFLDAKVSFSMRVKAKDAQNRVTFLLRQAWEILAESKGFIAYPMANRINAWYVPLGLFPKDKVAFTDVDGRSRRRQLAGTSEKHQVNWHYALTAFPVLNPPRRLELHSHVIFTNFDGSLVEQARMHRLRRGFCKSWWNDRWRGFLRAYLSVLAGDRGYISMSVGSSREVRFSALPMRFSSPVSLSDLAPTPVDEDVELEDLSGDFDASDYCEGDDRDEAA